MDDSIQYISSEPFLYVQNEKLWLLFTEPTKIDEYLTHKSVFLKPIVKIYTFVSSLSHRKHIILQKKLNKCLHADKSLRSFYTINEIAQWIFYKKIKIRLKSTIIPQTRLFKGAESEKRNE